ncbi:MAG: hypothetical protein IPP40_09555 [bacterium]|nr:hypothetical protein [bacterium]
MFPIPQNEAHWHIVLAHIPAILFMVSILIMTLATIWRDVRWQRVALGIIVAATFLVVVTVQFGQKGEGYVWTQDKEQYIEPHEELAETARNIILPFGILILALWWFTRKHTMLPVWASWGAVVVMMGITILLLNVAALGGKVTHPETRAGFVGAAREQESGEKEDDQR